MTVMYWLNLQIVYSFPSTKMEHEKAKTEIDGQGLLKRTV